ncbi:hypothetical protein KSS93_09770 [Pseudomonas xanthosomatis]|nr:hypothetical protein KSS93_09770 [Pseudomonas xanthosomatis]
MLRTFQKTFNSLEQARPFVRLIDDFIRDYPDPFMLASGHAAGILRKHLGKALDPRFVWWHQFHTASNSPSSFTGWQHNGPPVQSLTLTQLVVQRFELYFQEAVDELQVYGGFYRQGAQAASFDERNELRLLPRDVQDDLWALDFGARYRDAIKAFWAGSGRHFKVLARLNLLGQATRAERAMRISTGDLGLIRQMLGVEDGSAPLTLAQLQRDTDNGPLTVSRYEVGHGSQPWFYSLAAAHGRVLMYLPWSAEPLRGFDSEQDMAGWLRKQLQAPKEREAFLQAARESGADPAQVRRMRDILRSIADSRNDETAEVLLSYMRRHLGGNFFVYLAEQAETQMHRTAALMLDNAALRKAMWSGYLSVFLRVFGSFAPLGWPMSLLLLGASVARLALDVDAAADAGDLSARQDALRRAMLDTLGAAFSLLDLSFGSSFASLSYQAPAHELDASLQLWDADSDPDPEPLEDLVSNQLDGAELVEDGIFKGVSIHQDGSCRISLAGLSYRVRYSSDLASWLIVPEDNPFAFTALRPVRLNAQGEWELLAPPRLLGGSPPSAGVLRSLPSPFWERYVQVDKVASGKLSARARVRQKALLTGLPVLERGQLPQTDEHGVLCMLVDGKPVYSYLQRGDGFHNELVEFFTDEDSQINKVLRYGSYEHSDTDSYIAKLADALEALPTSNRATLYRGGNAARGTGGAAYRNGQLKVGDLLINTDLTSFTENPFIVPQFAAKPSTSAGQHWLFDDSSVVFELPAGAYQGGTPISAFSMYWEEAETLFLPGQYFRIEQIEQYHGPGYHFIRVLLRQVLRPLSGPAYDLRTGALFDRAVMHERIRTPALAQRFFP